ncbi:hypothetical protein GGC64_006372 [Mycobacterium sp. OAS707]|uniref:hypothetical protein n=1 Tax=Mycobacterium sp. OAS707 TaxID=2663822 RepID=UPI00178BFFB8|nr:hypothetical protein [Mycobacterium sp. OAS707]MBE1552285.1 hypothetical protein [Mycobacterium sp. OAS707]
MSELSGAHPVRIFTSAATLLVLAAAVLMLRVTGQPIAHAPRAVGVSPFPSASSVPTDRVSAGAAQPSLIVSPDRYGATCGHGIQMSQDGRWPTRTGRASPETPCAFAFNVLTAYQREPREPGTTPIVIAAESVVPCPQTGAQCAGASTQVSCEKQAEEDWITCTAEEGLRVYLF